MFKTAIKTIVEKFQNIFFKKNKFELEVELSRQRVKPEAIHYTQSHAVDEHVGKVSVVGIFVDFDNLFSHINDTATKQGLIRNIDAFFTFVAKRYKGLVKVNVYGNLSYWQLEAKKLEQENIIINYIDTPVVNGHGKTTTDCKMVVDMMKATHTLSYAVLVSCDVDFEHLIQHYIQERILSELIKFGHVNRRLELLFNKVVNGFDVLQQSKIIKSKYVSTNISKKGINTNTPKKGCKYADEILIEAIKSSSKGLHLAEAGNLLKDFKHNNWQGHKNLTLFIISLNIPNLKLDNTQNGLLTINDCNRLSIEQKLKSMEVPVLSARQYKTIFNLLSTHALSNEPAKLIDIVHVNCKELGCFIKRKELEQVVVKILPDISKSNKPYVLASKYLKWLFHKSKVSYKGILSTKDRETLAMLIQG